MTGTEKHLYSSDEKIKWWGYGEWVEEPDVIEFQHEGIECRVVRIAFREPCAQDHVFGGHLCGYVHVPKDHPWYNKAWGEIEGVDVHGGITYSELDEANHNYLSQSGRWIGFDCSHSGDIIPSMELEGNQPKSALRKLRKELKQAYPTCDLFNPKYRNISYCVQECKSLANQVKNSYQA